MQKSRKNTRKSSTAPGISSRLLKLSTRLRNNGKKSVSFLDFSQISIARSKRPRLARIWGTESRQSVETRSSLRKSWNKKRSLKNLMKFQPIQVLGLMIRLMKGVLIHLIRPRCHLQLNFRNKKMIWSLFLQLRKSPRISINPWLNQPCRLEKWVHNPWEKYRLGPGRNWSLKRRSTAKMDARNWNSGTWNKLHIASKKPWIS